MPAGFEGVEIDFRQAHAAAGDELFLEARASRDGVSVAAESLAEAVQPLAAQLCPAPLGSNAGALADVPEKAVREEIGVSAAHQLLGVEAPQLFDQLSCLLLPRARPVDVQARLVAALREVARRV